MASVDEGQSSAVGTVRRRPRRVRVVNIQLAGNSHAPAPTDESVEHILIRRNSDGLLEFPLRHCPRRDRSCWGG